MSNFCLKGTLNGLVPVGPPGPSSALFCPQCTTANLFVANLRGANLTDANFANAMNAGNANISGAIRHNTTCPDSTNRDADNGTCIGHGFFA